MGVILYHLVTGTARKRVRCRIHTMFKKNQRPGPLQDGDQVELWLATPPPDTATSLDAWNVATPAASDARWDVRPAQVTAVSRTLVTLNTGGWDLPRQPGTHVLVRRIDSVGIIEWQGITLTTATSEPGASPPLYAGTLLHVQLASDAGGELRQRRRSPRVPVRLTPIRLWLATPKETPEASDSTTTGGELSQGAPSTGEWGRRSPHDVSPFDPMDEDTLPVARLTDVSATGAGLVVDYPVPEGTTVALEFDLPGARTPFTVQGRVIQPAISPHGEAQPQPDGIPGFRRGVEFTVPASGQEYRRLRSVLNRTLRAARTRTPQAGTRPDGASGLPADFT